MSADPTTRPLPLRERVAALFRRPEIDPSRATVLKRLHANSDGLVDPFRNVLAMDIAIEILTGHDAITVGASDPTATSAQDGIAAEPALASCVTAVFKLPTHDTNASVRLPRDMLRKIVNAAYGGLHMDPKLAIPEDITDFELAFAEDLTRQILKTTVKILNPATHKSVELEWFGHPHKKPPLELRDALTSQPMLTVACQLSIAREIAGTYELVLPLCLDDTSPTRNEETLRTDAPTPNWGAQLETSLATTSMQLRAIASGSEMSLGEIAALRPGMTLALCGGHPLAVTLECNAEPLCKGTLGQRDGRYAVHLTSNVDAETNIADAMLAPPATHPRNPSDV